MPVREPGWWYGPVDDWKVRLLEPAANVWAWVAARRVARASPSRSALPVICIGNFTAGGTGKTPLSVHIARLLIERGERPVFLTRGYGGSLRGPHRVRPGIDTAAEVGDEPLLLARHAPVVVARDRAAGAALAAGHTGNSPPTVVLMDDGLQNPALAKDLSIAVVDSRRGLGNGRVIPAGPMRAPIEVQLGLADVIVVNHAPGTRGGDEADSPVVANLRERFNGPVLEARVEPEAMAELADAPVLALAGIANPARFYATLRGLGARIVATAEFEDHHRFRPSEARQVLADARRHRARIVTTDKDWARLTGTAGALAELAGNALVVPIRLAFEPRDEVRLASLVDTVLLRHRKAKQP